MSLLAETVVELIELTRRVDWSKPNNHAGF